MNDQTLEDHKKLEEKKSMMITIEQSNKIINSMKTKCKYLSRDLEKLEKTLEEEKRKWKYQ